MSMQTLATRAQSARRRYEQSKQSQRDFELYMGECAVLAFDLWVESLNVRKPPAAQVAVTQATRVAVRLMGEAFADQLRCPVGSGQHHENFARTVWDKAVQHQHEAVDQARALARHLGLKV